MTSLDEQFQFEIMPLREEISRFDDLIFFLLECRFEVSDQVAEVKAKYDRCNHDFVRETELIERAISEHPNLSPEFITQLYGVILNYSRQRMEKARQRLSH